MFFTPESPLHLSGWLNKFCEEEGVELITATDQYFIFRLTTVAPDTNTTEAIVKVIDEFLDAQDVETASAADAFSYARPAAAMMSGTQWSQPSVIRWARWHMSFIWATSSPQMSMETF